MSISKLIINRIDSPSRIPFDKEKPYCQIISIERDNCQDDKPIDVQFYIKHVYLDSSIESKPIAHSMDFINNKVDISFPSNFYGVKESTVYFQEVKDADSVNNNERYYLNYARMEKMNIDIPTVGFDEHLDDTRNIKILFSAPFGQGKSTFLDFYFAERPKKYNVFHLYPVNYSVAGNEDIFKYIKCALLIQLLDYSELFKKETVEYSKTFSTFFGKNAHKIFAPLLLLNQTMGRNMFTMFEKWDELKEEYLKYHKNQQINEDLIVKDYVQQFYDQEGGLFDDNLYTQLIRQLMERLVETNPNKENVLIIDDLDRMDPEHIFRILNVFSAHYDNFHNSNEQHKLGFDRVILVCDYENIRKIYEYRYGRRVDFKGYINKYFSTTVFDYNNTRVVDSILRNIDNLPSDNVLLNKKHYHFFYQLTRLLAQAQLISLRDILKLRAIGLDKQRVKLHHGRYKSPESLFPNSACSPAILLLSELGNTESLLKLVEQLNIDNKSFSSLEYWCQQLAAGISYGRKIVKYELRNTVIHLEADLDDDDFFLGKEITPNNPAILAIAGNKTTNGNLNKDDFLELLKLNIEQYQRLK